ncbi:MULTISPECIES: S-layer homology domain-containing protein [Paenibacillus]|uniref:Amylopullulanase n=1 Tax=Paenibacillus odorifer TaxID=189426 RepID=A0A1R0XCD1_9BACL|nr:S-layer homology domain-containing protein [Paenibacillus odorifer]AIQ74051.1 amylopullulanase [Paenibacillus odorifer]MEC0130495.1 S-layer homology domain-containing protein [Paenibacillus odorifer]MEC0220706.1 S-layer homology domain-containing protein [Paenibacillus odorifer]OMC94591.1 amylopullulanase [Paenibacillus odorifer]OMC99079.1 amylopullulanase [Paenibacillus odorifer]
MNMKKSTLAAITTVAIFSFSLGGQMFAAGNTFKDIDNINGKEKIISLKNQGLIKGVSESQFLPGSKVTTAQGIQFISGGLQLSLAAIDFNKAPVASGLFTKVKDKAWYAEAFINAYYNEVKLPKDIDPNLIMTKEQFTNYLVQAIEGVGNLPMINIVPVDIADEASLTPAYQGSIQRSLKYKINSLDANGKFNPKSELTRAEAAIMLYNALEFLKTGV